MGIGGADHRPHRVVFTLRSQPETSNKFLEMIYDNLRGGGLELPDQPRPGAAVCIARDPGVRLRDSAARTGVTERTAYGIVTDLTQAGYVALTGERHRQHLVTPGTVSGAVAADAAWSARSATGNRQAACEVSSPPGRPGQQSTIRSRDHDQSRDRGCSRCGAAGSMPSDGLGASGATAARMTFSSALMCARFASWSICCFVSVCVSAT